MANIGEAELQFSSWLDNCIKDGGEKLGLPWDLIVHHLLIKALCSNLKEIVERNGG